MSACGLDFGTSNTTLGVPGDGAPALVRLEGDAVTVPSAIFLRPTGEATIGRAAVDLYVDGQAGRLMRSLKSVLGKPLLDEFTPVGRKRVTFRDLIGLYLGAVKSRAEEALGREIGVVVHGRPVHFVDGDPDADRQAEEALRQIAMAVGFREVSFEYEPVAAALDYERTLPGEQVALIADIGGGTADFSALRIGGTRRRSGDRRGDILANDGVRIGGTDFDRLLSLHGVMPELGLGSPTRRPGLDVPSSPFHELATWSSINRLYAPKARREIAEMRRDAARPELIDRLISVVAQERGHTLAMEVERAKIDLADVRSTEIPLDWVEDGLRVAVDRDALVAATGRLAGRLRETAQACLRRAGLSPERVDVLFLTGGSTRLLHARAAIASAVPSARIVEGDTFGSVGLGLSIEAGRRYGSTA